MTLKWAKTGPNMIQQFDIQEYSSGYHTRLFFENLSLRASRSKDNVEIDKTWPYYGLSMRLTWSF